MTENTGPILPTPEDRARGTPGRGLPSEAIRCAYCASTETEFFSLFGQSLLSSQYYCHSCRTVFESVRWLEEEQDDPPGR